MKLGHKELRKSPRLIITEHWISNGHWAVRKEVIRGSLQISHRETMREVIEHIHGDDAQFYFTKTGDERVSKILEVIAAIEESSIEMYPEQLLREIDGDKDYIARYFFSNDNVEKMLIDEDYVKMLDLRDKVLLIPDNPEKNIRQFVRSPAMTKDGRIVISPLSGWAELADLEAFASGAPFEEKPVEACGETRIDHIPERKPRIVRCQGDWVDDLEVL